MKKACSFLIVCLILTACKAPRQAVLPTAETVIFHDTVIVTVTAPVPASENTVDFFTPWESLTDSLFAEDSTSFAEVVMAIDTATHLKHYKIRHGRKATEVTAQVPIVITDTFYITKACPMCVEVPKGLPKTWQFILAGLWVVILCMGVALGKMKSSSS